MARAASAMPATVLPRRLAADRVRKVHTRFPARTRQIPAPVTVTRLDLSDGTPRLVKYVIPVEAQGKRMRTPAVDLTPQLYVPPAVGLSAGTVDN